MIDWKEHALSLVGDRRAVTAFEYAVIAAFIALVISGALTVLEDI